MSRVAVSSGQGPGSRRVIRIGIAIVVAFDLLQLSVLIPGAREARALAGRDTSSLLGLLSAPVLTWALALGGLALTARMALAPGRWRAGLGALAVLGTLVSVHGALFGAVNHHLYFSGLTLLGWIAGQVWAQRRGTPGDESWAYAGALASLGACYFNAGISKLLYSGADWINSANLRAVVLVQHGLIEDGSLFGAFRAWVVESPGLAWTLAALTVVIELAGPLLLAPPVWRALLAVALVLMHLTILVLTDVILYIEAMYLLVLLGIPWRFPAEPEERAAGVEGGPSKRQTAWVTLALCGAGGLGMAMNAADERSFGDDESDLQGRRPVLRAGPLAEGLTVAGYRVSSVEAARDEALIHFDTPEAVSLFVRCSSERNAPAEPADFQLFFRDPSGNAAEPPEELGERFVAMLIRSAGEGGCGQFRRWMQDAPSVRP